MQNTLCCIWLTFRIKVMIPLLFVAESLICLTGQSQISLLTAAARLLLNVSPETILLTNMFSMHDFVLTVHIA